MCLRVLDKITTMNLYELCNEHQDERRNGKVFFRSPFFRLLCRELGIKWSDLSRTGKMVLYSDAADSIIFKRAYFKDGNFYLSFKK